MADAQAGDERRRRGRRWGMRGHRRALVGSTAPSWANRVPVSASRRFPVVTSLPRGDKVAAAGGGSPPGRGGRGAVARGECTTWLADSGGRYPVAQARPGDAARRPWRRWLRSLS
jgi:hypothetical protein